jgi:hypothetical protein
MAESVRTVSNFRSRILSSVNPMALNKPACVFPPSCPISDLALNLPQIMQTSEMLERTIGTSA